jgi:hypothetical protein
MKIWNTGMEIVCFNVSSKSDNRETFVDIFDAKKPDFRLQLGKITASSGNR